jgi:thiamine-phosphate pyrophosphorylase
MKGLYAIIDPEHCLGRDPSWVANEVLAGGCAALQLRVKALSDRECLALARALAARCRAQGVPFWVNDRIDLALLADASGVHLGQDDIPLEAARSLLPGRSLGCSTHSLAQAEQAAREGADVIGFGPIFATRSKARPDPCVGLEGLSEVVRLLSCPVIAIGGITLEHAAAIASTGATYAAAIGAVCGAERPAEAAQALHSALVAAAPKR